MKYVGQAFQPDPNARFPGEAGQVRLESLTYEVRHPMKFRRLIEWLDDKLNPIVVKELRQAVQSRFVIAVLLLFLLAEVLLFGIFLAVNSRAGGLSSVEYHGGREAFAILQGIMLG